VFVLKASYKEQHSVIRFWSVAGHGANAIKSSVWCQVFYETNNTCLVKKFAYGPESVVDEERLGRHLVSTTDTTIAAVDSHMA